MCLPLHEAPEIQWSSLSHDICMRPGHHRNLGKKCCARVLRKWWWSIHPLMNVLRISCKHKHVYLRVQGGRRAKRRAIRTPQVGERIKNMWYNLTTGHTPWKVKVFTQLCPTLCDPMDCSTPSSSVHGTLQVRMLEWVAIPFSKVSSTLRDWTWVSCIAGIFFAIWATREAGTYPEETIIEKDTFTSMFIAALYTLQLGHGSNLDVHQQMNG